MRVCHRRVRRALQVCERYLRSVALRSDGFAGCCKVASLMAEDKGPTSLSFNIEHMAKLLDSAWQAFQVAMNADQDFGNEQGGQLADAVLFLFKTVASRVTTSGNHLKKQIDDKLPKQWRKYITDRNRISHS